MKNIVKVNITKKHTIKMNIVIINVIRTIIDA